jgi:hypothetical protein
MVAAFIGLLLLFRSFGMVTVPEFKSKSKKK